MGRAKKNVEVEAQVIARGNVVPMMTETESEETVQYVSDEDAAREDRLVSEIRMITEQTKQVVLFNSIEIGRRLTEAKAMVKRGTWGTWLKERVDYSQRTANNFMKIYQEYGRNGLAEKSQALANLSYTQALALIDLPEDERARFAEERKAGEMALRKLQEEVRQEKEKVTAVKELANRNAAEAEAKFADELKQKDTQMAKLTAEKAKVAAQIEVLEKRAAEAEKSNQKRQKEAIGIALAVFEEDGLALDRVIGDGCVGDLAALDGNLSHRDTIDGDGVFAGGKGLVGGVCHAGGIPRQFHARHRVTGLAEFCGSSEDMVLNGDGIGLTLVYGNRGVGKLHLIVALLSHDGVVTSLDSRVASDLDLLAVLVLQDNRIFIRIDRDGGKGDILLDGDLFALIGADCDGSSGLEGLLVIDVPNVELGAGEDIIGTENGLVDLYLGRLVLLLYGSGHEIGLVVLIGKGELDRGRIEHMALRSLGLDEGIGCV